MRPIAVDHRFPICYTKSEALRRSVIAQPRTRINQDITAPQVRLVGMGGEQVGVVSRAEALEQAAAAGYDLVEIAASANPPVVKILDWGKYRYEQTKLSQKNRKHQRNQEVKQVRVGLKIGEHDLLVKVKHARTFIESGHKVKVSLRFRGREVTHSELGRVVLDRFMGHLEDIAVREQDSTLSGREMTMLLAPNKAAK
ncbi:MAG TPA: translation initiation factor IF-3 [Candidatus Saccharimonadales bacterium]|nr:translation initiation factor IF-3 [Candidatus Saccharimonadales bacterium]